MLCLERPRPERFCYQGPLAVASQSQANVVQLFLPLSFASVVLLKNQLFFIQHITNDILLSVPQPFMLKLFHFV